MPGTEAPTFRQSLAGPLGAFAALLLLGLAEALVVTISHPTPPTSALAGVVLSGLGTALTVLWVPLVFSAVSDVLLVAARRGGLAARLCGGLAFFAALGFSAYWYTILTTYEPFQGYWPFQLAVAGSVVGLVGHWFINRREWGAGWQQYVPAVTNTLMVLVGAAVHVVNYLVYRGLYPTMHHAALMVTTVLILRGFGAQAPRVRARPVMAIGALSVPILVIATAASSAVWAKSARAYFYHSSELGRVASMSQELALSNGQAGLGGAVRTDPSAPVRFAAASHLPALPESFRLEDYNVLLIGSEATRFDKTSLHPDGPATTPNLVEIAKSGWVASRAYSPSSGTLHSVSSLFTMKYPSAVDLVTWMQPWFGELSQSETTVAELFAEVGYKTFWIGHDHNIVLSRSILGLNQGFQELDLVPEMTRPHPKTTDAKIATKVERKLRQLAAKPNERFFGFVFFVSPHGPYVGHGFEDLPSGTDAEKYLQELRNVDDQLKRVFDTLRETKLMEKTVVVYLSDHGEEFREHGGARHKSTVYTESIHVPLLLWVPGLSPGGTSEPLSTLYLFPWLLGHAESPVLREPATDVLENLIGPVLRDTNSAVISELVGHDRIKTTLIYDKLKLNYDYRSRLFELYDVTVDPLEQNNIYASSDTATLESYFERYDQIRSATQKYSFLPKKKAPSVAEWRKMEAEKRRAARKAAPSKPAPETPGR